MQKPVLAIGLTMILAAPMSFYGQANKVALNPRASYVDVPERRTELKHAKSERIRTALALMEMCGE